MTTGNMGTITALTSNAGTGIAPPGALFPDASSRVISLISHACSREELWRELAQLLREWTGCSAVGIRLVEDDGTLPYLFSSGFSPDFLSTEGCLSMSSTQCACSRVFLGAPSKRDRTATTPAGSFCCNELSLFGQSLAPDENADYRGACISTGFESIALIPIRNRGRTEGLLHLADHRRNMFPTDLVTFLESAAPLLGETIRRYLAEDALRASEEKYRSVFEGSNEVIFLMTPHGRLLEVNPAGKRLLGYRGEEWKLLDVRRKICCDTRILPRIAAGLRRGRSVRNVETRLRHKSGEEVTVSLSAFAVRAPGGTVTGYRGIVSDITDRRRLEEQLLHSRKMESVGVLAGGIAHDFNNILTAINGYAQLLQEWIPAEDGTQHLHEAVSNVLQAGKKAAALTKSLLTFSRKQKVNLQPIELNGLIRESVKLLQRLIGEDITIVTELCERSLTVVADSGQLDQVLINLAVNARDAMRGAGGTLTIRTASASVAKTEAQAMGLRSPGEYAVMSFADTGPGIEPGVRDRIFEPFFTTKAVGEGTGLGLSIIYGILRDHGGTIAAGENEEGKTCFTIHLPVARAARRLAEAPRDETRSRRGGRILVAEDEEMVRTFLKNVLEIAGYDVVTAGDGDDAVTRLQEASEPFDLALVDVVMPKANGTAVRERMMQEAPAMPVVFISGYTSDIIHSKGVDDGSVDFLTKPVQRAELLRTVQVVLSRRKEVGR